MIQSQGWEKSISGIAKQAALLDLARWLWDNPDIAHSAVSPTRRPGGLVGQAVVTTFPIRKYLGGELLGSKNGMRLIRN
jgi:hypothetical protein